MNKFSQPGKLKEVVGSITTPELSSLRLILVPCSMNDKFDGELQKLLTKRWAKVREEYRSWYSVRQDFKLGSTATLAIKSDTWCVYVLCKSDDGLLDSSALQTGLKKVAELAKYEKASVHISHLTTAEMPEVKDLANQLFVQQGINTVFYQEKSQ